jgi:hypothetical protein
MTVVTAESAPMFPPCLWKSSFALFTLSVSIPLCNSSALGQVQTNPAATPSYVPPSLKFRASPRVIQPLGGKLPSTMTLAVLGNCDDPKINLSTQKLVITGSGLSLPLDQQKASKCVISGTLTIDPNTPPGIYTVLIANKSDDVAIDSTEISVLDTGAGAIPPGLAPEMDVMWNVMTQNDCSDVFGKRVAQSLYCIQLKIGNNSGHPIQLAGIGFARSLKALEAVGIPQVTIANTSYASTRAVLVESQVWSTRNIVYNSIVGAGLIMTASAPFYSGIGRKSLESKTHYLTVSGIVNGPLQQAFNLLFPDPIVSQLKSLDDQSFRDNVVIPNNSQVQTVVFVEKENLTVGLRELQIQLSSGATELQKKTAATTQATEGTDQLDASALLARTEIQAAAMDRLASNSESTVKNSTARNRIKSGRFDPMLVKIALGSIVVVGDMIQYLQRVQVQNSATTGSQVVVAVAPSTAQVPVNATKQLTATVSNDQNSAGVTWSLSGPNCAGDTCGKLSGQTATTVTYAAPAVPPGPNITATITATSKADTTKSATATVTITPGPITVTISPKPAPPVSHGVPAPLVFNVAITYDPAAAGVKWSLSGAGCKDATCGTLTAQTLTSVSYNPPLNKPAPNIVTLTATSNSDGMRADTVTITIN